MGDIEHTLSLPENAALNTAFHATHTDLALDDPNRTFGYGDRLFQAARFVTEMEYQHLVFEEFARKVQPAVKPFHVYSPDINPAIHAEFAHAVYRFGHSMLDDDVARKNADGSDNSLPLLTAFLNPPEFFDGGTAGTLHAAAGCGQHRDGLLGPDRQRAGRVRDGDPAQQPAGSAARPGGDQHDPGP